MEHDVLTNPSYVAVASRSFSKHRILRSELTRVFPNSVFNETGNSLTGDDLVTFLRPADYAVLGLERVDIHLLNQLPRLKGVAKFGVGTDALDLVAIEHRSIRLGVVPGTNANAVAELVVLMALACRRRLIESLGSVTKGQWRQTKGSELSGATIGIIGLGHVGRRVVALLAGFGCEIVAFDVSLQEPVPNVSMVSLAELLERANVVSVHLPLNDSTRGFIGQAELSLMRSDAVLINTSRGGVVDETALTNALLAGTLAAAALDVLADEPSIAENILRTPNLLITPHIGGSTEESILRMGRAAIDSLIQFTSKDSVQSAAEVS